MCIYIKSERMGVDVFILVYVDDLLIISDLAEAAEQVQEEITRTFKARVKWEPTYVLPRPTH